MRSTLVSVALVAIVGGTGSCRFYRTAPAGAASGAAAHSQAAPSGLDTRAVVELPNGLKVVLEENHAAPVVALQAWVHVGSVDSPAGKEGIANLFPHLLFLSATNRRSPPIADQIAALGGRIGGWSTHEETVLHGTVAAPFTAVAIDLFAEILTRPPLSPADIEGARLAAKDDLRQSTADLGRLAAQAVLTTAFAGHPYGRPLLGTDSSLAAITPDQVRTFFQTFYRPDNTTLVIVGDFDAVAVRARVAAAFGAWPPRRSPRVAHALALTAPGAPRVAVVTADIAAPQLVVAFRVPGRAGTPGKPGISGMSKSKAGDLPTLELIAALLGGRRGGRLEMEIVRNRQLVTSPRAYLFNAREGGLLITTATVAPGRVDDAVRAVHDEVIRLSREKIAADELARARTIVEGDGAAAKASWDGYARKLGLSMAIAGDPGFESAYLEQLRTVDAEAVMEVARRLLTPANLVISVILPAAADERQQRQRPGQRQIDDRPARLLPRLHAVASSRPATTATPAALPSATPSGQEARQVRDVFDFALPSGVRLLVLRDDTAPQLAVRAVWSGGVRFEDSRLAGATSLLARLLPRVTKTRAPDDLAAELADVGGTLDAVAGLDSLALRGDFLATHWERGLELLVDCVRNPRFTDDDIERERRVLLAALRSREDDPTELALRLFQGALFGRHPYRQGLLGTSDSVAGLNRRRLLDHYRRHYGARRLTLVVLGAVRPDQVAAKVQSLFGDIAPVGGDGDIPAPLAQPAQVDRREVFQFIPKAQARLVLGFPGVTLRDGNRFALEVLAQILGGAGGRLQGSTLRDRGILSGQVGAVSQESVDPGYFAVFVATRPDAIDAAVPAVRAELRRLVEGGVTDDEVLRARQILMGTRALALDRRGAVATALALNAAFGDSGRPGRRDIDELGKVTLADVARVARLILDPSREIVAVVRPRDGDRPERATTTTTIQVLPQAMARYTYR